MAERLQIRWSSAARAGGIALGVAALIGIALAALRPPEPAPLPPDVGLAGIAPPAAPPRASAAPPRLGAGDRRARGGETQRSRRPGRADDRRRAPAPRPSSRRVRPKPPPAEAPISAPPPLPAPPPPVSAAGPTPAPAAPAPSPAPAPAAGEEPRRAGQSEFGFER